MPFLPLTCRPIVPTTSLTDLPFSSFASNVSTASGIALDLVVPLDTLNRRRIPPRFAGAGESPPDSDWGEPVAEGVMEPPGVAPPPAFFAAASCTAMAVTWSTMAWACSVRNSSVSPSSSPPSGRSSSISVGGSVSSSAPQALRLA